MSEFSDESSFYVTSVGSSLYEKKTAATFSQTESFSLIMDLVTCWTPDVFNSLDCAIWGTTTFTAYLCNYNTYKYDTSKECEYSYMTLAMEDESFYYMYVFIENPSSDYVNFFISRNSHEELSAPALPSDIYLYSLSTSNSGINYKTIFFVES